MNGEHRSERRSSYVGSLSKPMRSLDKGKITNSGSMNAHRGLGPTHIPAEMLLQTGDVREEVIEAAKSVLLSEKQAQLETIVARHDDIVLGRLGNLTILTNRLQLGSRIVPHG